MTRPINAPIGEWTDRPATRTRRGAGLAGRAPGRPKWPGQAQHQDQVKPSGRPIGRGGAGSARVLRVAAGTISGLGWLDFLSPLFQLK